MTKIKMINAYLEKNQIIKIGNGYSDIIVKDWEDFLLFLYFKNYSVTSILWWEYLKIQEQGSESIGCGGPRDSQNPEWMWSETMIFKNFTDSSDVDEIKGYIKRTIDEYAPKKIIPSFTIKV